MASLQHWRYILTVYLFIYDGCYGINRPIVDLPVDDVYIDGDVILAVLLPLFYSTSERVCGGKIHDGSMQSYKALLKLRDEIHASETLLKNITLGLVFLGECFDGRAVLVRASQLVPPNTTCVTSERPHYDVTGVMGPLASTGSVLSANLLGAYGIPQVSWLATSDELSDKKKFPYFSRTIPPDKYQAKAIVDLAVYFGWTYITLISSNGNYGRNGGQNVAFEARQADLCIAYSVELSLLAEPWEYDYAVVQMRKNYKARVVVMFASHIVQRGIFEAIHRAGAGGEFIFICPDSFSSHTVVDIEEVVDGTIYLSVQTKPDVEFQTFYRAVSPWRVKSNAWLGQYTPDQVGCTFDKTITNMTHCSEYEDISKMPGFFWSVNPVLTSDTLLVYANALDALIKDKCLHAVGNRKELRNCIEGPTLNEYIRQVDTQGKNSYLKFDEYGDLLGGYTYMYYQKKDGVYVHTAVGRWDRSNGGLDVDVSHLGWMKDNVTVIPESVCAKPCETGEYYIQGELKCCWECRSCRDNERLQEDYRGCETCDQLTWPDQENLTTCEDIDPSFMQWTSDIGFSLAVVAGIGLVSTFALSIIFIWKGHTKVIRGSSRELMVPLKVGVFLSYTTVFLFLAEPHDYICYSNYFGFHISCTLIFGPLFLKTLRLYRIFAAAERCQIKVRAVDAASQIIMVILSLILQIGLGLTAFFLHIPEAKLTMPVATERFVELLCSQDLLNLLLPLSFNILLLFLCAVFGFLTRKLPDNFNESWYIFISVVTTLFIWIAFLPTYLLAFYAYHKAALLSLALILSAAVTSVCLFVPKIYAVFFVDEKDIKTTNFENSQFYSNDTTMSTVVNNDSVIEK